MRRLLVILCSACSLITPFDELTTKKDASSDDGTMADTVVVDVMEEPIPVPKPPCDVNAQPSAMAVFASTSKGMDAFAGTAAAPVKTITRALQIAKMQNATDLYLEEGNYDEEITIASPTNIHGGWKATGAKWTRDCADGVVGLTLIRSPTTRAVNASGFGGKAGLDFLTIVTKAQGGPSESGIAIFVTNVTLALVGVDITAASGGPGTTPMIPAQTGTASCNGSSCSDGTAGAAAGAGPAAMAGTFGAMGWTPAIGGAGQPGTAGHTGTPGGMGQSGSNCVLNCGAPPGCADGSMGSQQAADGKCGCNGLGGTGGPPGTSGGASVGVYAFGTATVTLDFTAVRASAGGDGAAGAMGGAGGPGANGATGANSFCASACFYSNPSCFFTGSMLFGGSPGGKGGVGGQGGQGGGGAGGPSYGVVSAGGAQTTVLATTNIQAGKGGQGASGAPSGGNAQTFQAP